jgi:hypothetical protein
MDVTKLAKLGWRASIPLQKGLRMAYESALQNGQLEAVSEVRKSTSIALSA